MRQPGGIGSAVEWHDPADYIESLFGFRRYFTLENTLCRALFDLGRDPPAAFQAFKRLRVSRRAGRVQTPGGAAASALYASAFAIQARNMRAAANHVIQASGAQITKALQARLWEFQPSGVRPWRLTLMQVHDEVLSARLASVSLGDAVGEVVESYRPAVPLIKMEWKTGLRNWFEK
jgi:DNA polymerase I-like protein with 3'-5' exonuclease and polymerase domains